MRRDRGAAVLDFGGAVSATSESGAQADPWKALASGNGMLVSWEPAPTERRKADVGSGARTVDGVRNAARGRGRTRRGRSSREDRRGLFRVELPAGQVLQNLVPAVGGGFRGMTRAAGSARIAGQARLLPVGAAAVGVGTGVALGPLIGIMALTVGAEMLAQHQLQAKLDAILSAWKPSANILSSNSTHISRPPTKRCAPRQQRFLIRLKCPKPSDSAQQSLISGRSRTWHSDGSRNGSTRQRHWRTRAAQSTSTISAMTWESRYRRVGFCRLEHGSPVSRCWRSTAVPAS